MAEHTTQENAPPPPRRPTIIRAGVTPITGTTNDTSKGALENGDVTSSSVSPPPQPAASVSPPPRPATSVSPPPRPASIASPPPRPTLPPPPASSSSKSGTANTAPDDFTEAYPIPTPPRPVTTHPPPKPPPPSSVPKASPKASSLKGGRPEITIVSARPMSEVSDFSKMTGSTASPTTPSQNHSGSPSPAAPPPVPSNRPKVDGPGRPPPPAPGRPATSPPVKPTVESLTKESPSTNSDVSGVDSQASGSGSVSAASSGRASPAAGPVPPPLPANRPTGRYVPPPLPANRPSRAYVHPVGAVSAPPRPSTAPSSGSSSRSVTPPVPPPDSSEVASKKEQAEQRATPPPPGAVTSVGPPLPVRPKIVPEHQAPSKVPPPVPPMPTSRSSAPGSTAKPPTPPPPVSPKPANVATQAEVTAQPTGKSTPRDSPSPVTASKPATPPPVASKPSSVPPPVFQKPQPPPGTGRASATPPPVSSKPSVSPPPTGGARPSSTPPGIAAKPAVAAKPPVAAKPDSQPGTSQPITRSQTPPQQLSASSSVGGVFGVMLRPTIGPKFEEPLTKKATTETENKTEASSVPISSQQQKRQSPFTVSPTQDPFSQQKQSEPFSSQNQPDPFTAQKQTDPFSRSQQQDPFSAQTQADPFSSQDPFLLAKQSDQFSSQPKHPDPFSPTLDPFAPSKPQSDPFSSQPQPDPFSPTQQKPFGSWPPPTAEKTSSSVAPSSFSGLSPVTAPPPVPASRPRPKPGASSSNLSAVQISAPPPVPSTRPGQTDKGWQPTPLPRTGSQKNANKNNASEQQDMSSFIKEIEGLYTKPPSPQPSEQPATDGNDGAAAPVAKPLPPPPSGSSATARPTIIRPSKTSAKGAPPPRPAGGPKISSNSTAASLLDMPIPGTQEEPQTMKKSSSASAIGRSQSMRMPPARPTSQPKKKAPAPPRPAPITKGPQKPARSAPVRPNTGTKAKAGAPSLPQRPGPGHPLFKYMVTEPHAIAVFPYNKQNYDELSFEQDDVIILLRKVDDDWMFGRNVDQEGMFPKKFVRVVQALPGERPGRVEGPSAVASYDYDSTAPDDLNFNKGDFIKLLSRCGDDWYRGECNGEVGMFPKTFVEVLEDLPEEKEEVKPDTLSGPRCRARFDFEAEGEEDLDFDEGDIIRLIEPVGEEWMRGELNGKVGIFPLEFVEIIENLPASSIAMATQVDSPPPSASITVTPPTPTADDNLVTALYDFEGTDNTELTFKTGDKIKVTNQVNADWLVGEMYGKSGRFPSNFIDRVPNNLPPVAEDLPAAQSGPHCIAKFDYDGTPPDDLSFKEGDKIMLTERVGADWYKGTCNGQEGMFPKTFVEVVEDLPSDKGAKQSTRQRGGSFEELMPKAEALYDFTGESDGDLSFKAGDTIYLLNKVTDEWYNGELNGKVGQFPVAFVEIIIPLPGPRGL